MSIHKEFNLNDLPEELKGDIVPEINPEKLFDEKEYATLIIGNDVGSKSDLKNADFISIIVNDKSTREEKDEALLILKTHRANNLLISAIAKTKNPIHKALVIAACWETGLDFSEHYLTFVELICSDHFNVSFEAYTVISEMEAEISEDILLKAENILTPYLDKNSNAKLALEYISNKLKTI
jgi:hypothetical protein